MMDFDRKHFIMQKISQNGGMYQQILVMQQQMLQLAQMVDRSNGTNLAEQIAAGITGGVAPAPVDGSSPHEAEKNEALGGSGKQEHAYQKRARERVAESTDPT
jgi:hypothetical protein